MIVFIASSVAFASGGGPYCKLCSSTIEKRVLWVGQWRRWIALCFKVGESVFVKFCFCIDDAVIVGKTGLTALDHELRKLAVGEKSGWGRPNDGESVYLCDGEFGRDPRLEMGWAFERDVEFGE
jgi:hypothetical protein